MFVPTWTIFPFRTSTVPRSIGGASGSTRIRAPRIARGPSPAKLSVPSDPAGGVADGNGTEVALTRPFTVGPSIALPATSRAHGDCVQPIAPENRYDGHRPLPSAMGPEAPIIVVPYDNRWPGEFREVGRVLRVALGAVALRIDHVGSTSVPGLDAKPVIDIQVAVASLEPDAPFREPMVALGYRLRDPNPDRTKRFFVEPEGGRPTHVHVRELGSFDEQLNLLFRDYLRSHVEVAREYAQVKWDLSTKFRDDRDGYVRAKEPAVWSILRRAHDWAQATGWRPGPPDV